MSRVCLCLSGSHPEDLLAQVEHHRPHIDMAELRLDLVKPEMRSSLADFPLQMKKAIPLILTVRLPEDGGEWGRAGESEEDRLRLMVRFLEHGGWDWVDLEHGRPMDSVADAARRSGARIILSQHDFSGDVLNRPLPELADCIRRISDQGCLPKLAARCDSSRQLLTLARLGLACADCPEKLILGMGEFGIPSRILAQRIGSAWTYTSSAENSARLAPGQMDPLTLNRLYRYRELDANTALFAVIGDPIAHSKSPEIHNNWLREGNLNASYLPIRTDDVGALMEVCDIWGIRALSVTVPHKEKALTLCDYVDDAARRIGAVNTVLRSGDGWRGRNTDAAGFLQPLPRAMGVESLEQLKGEGALVIGAGGAARAAVHALAGIGFRMVILNRTEAKARRLAAEVSALAAPLSSSSHNLTRGLNLVVQTTTVGMRPDEDPAPWCRLGGRRLVYDMIYEPNETALMKRAAAAGVKAINGEGMLRAQARMQFELFTGGMMRS